MTKRTAAVTELLERRQLLSGISGTVFNDRNNNATYESSGPDIPWPSVTVYLDANGNKQLDAGETSVLTGSFTSGQAGIYQFTNLALGTYTVRVVPPTNFLQTFPTNNDGRIVTLSNPQTSTINVNFGIRDVTQSSRIAGRAYSDANANGSRDSGEPVLPNVTVYADLDDDGVLDPNEQSTVTDSTGNFKLDVLNPNYTATYKIRAVAPVGLTQTTQNSTAGAYVVTIDAGNGTLPTDVFGFADKTPPSVASAKLDIDANPHVIRFDLTEPNVNGSFTVAFALTVKRLSDNTTLSPGAFTLKTNANGVLSYVANPSYIANGLLPDGLYQATLAANTLVDAAGNTNTAAYTFQFAVLRGDANGDRKVDFNDLVILAQNYGQTGRTFSQGNFDYSSNGTVDFNDLVILAQRYGTSLPANRASSLTDLSSTTDESKRRRSF